MSILRRTAIAACLAGTAMTIAFAPAGAGPMPTSIAAMKTERASSVIQAQWGWSNGWLDHGGWGGWGYMDGLVIDDPRDGYPSYTTDGQRGPYASDVGRRQRAYGHGRILPPPAKAAPAGTR